jgi:putative ABC transport system substrate-binding protein
MKVTSNSWSVNSETIAEKRMSVGRVALFCLLITLFLITALAQAQQPKKVPRVGFLRHGSPPDPLVDAFRRGLRDTGYVEGESIAIEYRWTEGKSDRLDNFAAELVGLKVDALVAPGVLAARAAKQATTTIPIVITAIPDPIGEGFIASLARPGGNLTGLSAVSSDLSGKRLEIFKEAYPKLSRLAVLSTPAEEGGQAKATEVAAKSLGLQAQVFEVRRRTDIEMAFSIMVQKRFDGFVVLGSGILFEHRKTLGELAVKNRRPAMYPHKAFTEPDGLMSYGPDFPDLFRRTVVYLDKIFKGAKPSELPVEQPAKFELVINLKAAKQIGLTIPPNVLVRADKVIR